MSVRNRIKYGSRIKTQKSIAQQPFEESIFTVILEKCHKLQLQLQTKTKKQVLIDLKIASLLNGLKKDIQLLNKKQVQYSRMMSMVYNIYSNYYFKIEDYLTALNYVDEALQCQKQGKVDVVDTARTLLNKSVIMGQLAKKNNYETSKKILYSQKQNSQLCENNSLEGQNEYTHQQAIKLAKRALQIIKMRGSNSQSTNYSLNDEYKLGEIIIISFHNIASELSYLKNQTQAYTLYKKAYDLAIKILGGRHSLTKHLKTIISRYKEKQKNQIKQLNLQSNRNLKESSSKNIKVQNSKKKHKNTNQFRDETKYKSFFKIYHSNVKKKTYHNSLRTFEDDQDEMKELRKIKQMYLNKSNKGKTSELPYIRKNVRDIIKQGRALSQAKPRSQIKNETIRIDNKNIQSQNLKNIQSQNPKKSLENIQVKQIEKNQQIKPQKLKTTPAQQITKKQQQNLQSLQKNSQCQLI